ncbi:MAG: hypothetical protein DWQ10_12685 [Calditrichaeota bacterium]|nr:MAG: hypothetical protein DWQ10_12685 [Calditrichota bacterium]
MQTREGYFLFIKKTASWYNTIEKKTNPCKMKFYNTVMKGSQYKIDELHVCHITHQKNNMKI